MSTLFNLDSPIMRALSRMTDLLVLNLVTLVCCLPIVTIGASLTACHYVTLKMARHEESYVIRSFFKSFKQNFKQATALWLLLLLVVAVLVGDVYILDNIEFEYGQPLKIVIMVIGVMVLFTATFLFPTLAKFDNKIRHTIKNAFVISVLQFPKTITMILLNIVPFLVLFVIQIAPLSFMFGFSVPALLAAYMYSPFFEKLETQIVEKNGGPQKELEADSDKRIFFDSPDGK